MNRDQILIAPSGAHQGDFLASGTIYNMAGCVIDSASMESTSAEGVSFVENKVYLKQINTSGLAQDHTGAVYFAYKWPTNDDYLEHNSQSNLYMTDGEPIIGVRATTGIKIQTYIGTDYTNSSGVKIGMTAPGITWSSVSYGTELYFTDSGQLTTATTNAVVRAQFVGIKGSWITIELVDPFIY